MFHIVAERSPKRKNHYPKNKKDMLSETVSVLGGVITTCNFIPSV